MTYFIFRPWFRGLKVLQARILFDPHWTEIRPVTQEDLRQIAPSPYRHVETVRVEECASCERCRERKEAAAKAWREKWVPAWKRLEKSTLYVVLCALFAWKTVAMLVATPGDQGLRAGILVTIVIVEMCAAIPCSFAWLYWLFTGEHI